MTTPEINPPSGADYKCGFNFQDGWIDLTLDSGTKAEAMGLAAVAMKEFNPLETATSSQELFDDLVRRAMDLNGNGPILTAAYYTPGGVPLADLVVDSYADEGEPRPSPEEVQPLLLELSNAEVVGDPDVRHLSIEAGSAVRVQATVKIKFLLGFGRRLGELIKYAVFPPGFSSLVVITVTWRDTKNGELLTQLVDELVSNMRIVPVDSAGDEIIQNLPSGPGV